MEIFHNNSSVFNIIKGIIISFLFTVIALIVFSILLAYTDLSENTIQPVIITVTGISILIGSSLSTKKIKKNGILNGAIIGVMYIFIIYIISSLISSNFAINIMSLIMIAVGLIGGVLGRNNWSKCMTMSQVLTPLLYTFHSRVMSKICSPSLRGISRFLAPKSRLELSCIYSFSIYTFHSRVMSKICSPFLRGISRFLTPKSRLELSCIYFK